MNTRYAFFVCVLTCIFFNTCHLTYAQKAAKPIDLIPISSESSPFPQDSGWTSKNPDLIARIKPGRVVYFEFDHGSSGFIEYGNSNIKTGRYKIEGKFTLDGNMPKLTMQQDDSQVPSFVEIGSSDAKKIAKNINVNDGGIKLTIWIRCFGKCWGTIKDLKLIPLP
jgi:hypothetical protein